MCSRHLILKEDLEGHRLDSWNSSSTSFLIISIHLAEQSMKNYETRQTRNAGGNDKKKNPTMKSNQRITSGKKRDDDASPRFWVKSNNNK